VGSFPGPGQPLGTSATAKAFTTYDIQACLYDERRVRYLRDAIEQTVRRFVEAAQGRDVVVVDAGSGTGLLGLLAARAGATRVYCVELNPEFLAVIKHNAQNNDLEKQIIVECDDASVWQPPEQVDIIISEVISAGFFYEPQLQIVNNLRRSLKPGGVVVPAAMGNYVELIHAQEMLHDLKFTFDARFTELDGDRSLTHRARYLSTDFLGSNSTEIDSSATVRACETATANAVKITYDIQFAEGVSADKPTEFLLNPQIIFLPEPIGLREGHSYEVTLTYFASESPLACRIRVDSA
jgi:SAM-dependent methyltransferase